MADTGTLADWAAVGITAIGMIVSVGIVLYQLGKQHKGSIKLQRSNAREALKLRIYELFNEKVRAFSDADLEVGSYARSVMYEVQAACTATQMGRSREEPALRTEQLAKLHHNASSALIDLIFTLENWEVAFPASELFRVAFSWANHDVEEAFTPFFRLILPLLPVDMPDGTTIYRPDQNADKVAEIEALVEKYEEARTTLRTYTHDLVIEAQNLLLSKLFKRRVKIRKPIDPTYRVIAAADTEALLNYFKTETAGGRLWEKSKNNVKERLLAEGRIPQNQGEER